MVGFGLVRAGGVGLGRAGRAEFGAGSVWQGKVRSWLGVVTVRQGRAW